MGREWKVSMFHLNLSALVVALYTGILEGIKEKDTLVHDRPPEQMGLMYQGTHILDFVSGC